MTTASPEAQRYFDQGLCFLYAFNHDEAVRSFRQAAELDPGCAMAWWGVAIALGPHINNPLVPEERGKAAWEAIEKARSHQDAAGAVERALIEAASKRYAWPQPEDRKALDEAYAAAMEAVWRDHPRDADVGALYAEALMDLRPWDLWTTGGEPQPGTKKVLDVLEAVLAVRAGPPAGLPPVYPRGRGVAASREGGARRGPVAAPPAGPPPPGPHAVAHRRAARTLEGGGRGERARDRGRPGVPGHPAQPGFLPALHAPQPAHARLRRPDAGRERAGDRRGRRDARRAADRVGARERGDRRRLLRHAAGGPDAVRAVGRDPGGPGARGDVPDRAALRHAARGVAFAAQGRVEQARGAQEEFRSARKQVADDARFGNSPANILLDVAEHLLAGEVLYREGKEEEAFGELREAVRAEDALGYDEPPDWIQPVRHALGAALLESGRFEEAEAVYREDLRRLPDNGWSLFGLMRALELRGKAEEADAVRARWEEVWKDADVRALVVVLLPAGECEG